MALPASKVSEQYRATFAGAPASSNEAFGSPRPVIRSAWQPSGNTKCAVASGSAAATDLETAQEVGMLREKQEGEIQTPAHCELLCCRPSGWASRHVQGQPEAPCPSSVPLPRLPLARFHPTPLAGRRQPDWPQETTTVMLRGIPYSYTQEKLMTTIIEAGFSGTFDFLYMPLNRASGGRGYAFINFLLPSFAREFYEAFNSRKLLKSSKPTIVGMASWQGRLANVSALGHAATNAYVATQDWDHNGIQIQRKNR
eukprot:TRINITY_DN38789_c0_g2_i6.p1 TRINITY_DN38789_c0_g2~~TRINITY_DN38789_c0_g2_i6.p1  ORF type:complete len:269 (+),score=3.10 TRINITY_DN38789_c0_g2_i6:45-809(+)